MPIALDTNHQFVMMVGSGGRSIPATSLAVRVRALSRGSNMLFEGTPTERTCRCKMTSRILKLALTFYLR